MLECVINISEGRDLSVIAAISHAAGTDLLDVHTDPDHHRSVLTLVGEDAPRAVAAEAVARIDLRTHNGVHPRIGSVDVVPFVPLGTATLADAIAARDRFGQWAAETLGLPGFAYGPDRTLPAVRKHAFADLAPTWGPPTAHPSAGSVAVGARPVLVAYNVWLTDPDVGLAKRIAHQLRSPGLRTLGLAVGSRVQVSMNLVDPYAIGPAEAADAVAALASVAGCELVGLIPRAVLAAIPQYRWAALDLTESRTIEARLARRLLP